MKRGGRSARGLGGRGALLAAVPIAAAALFNPALAAGKVTRMDRSIVRVALDSSGQDYLEAEKAIAAAGARLHPAIRAETAGRSPLELAIADMLQGWESQGARWRQCLEKIDALGKESAKSVIGYPVPEQVAEVVLEEFANSCVPLLSVRLLKEGANWRFWKAAGVLLYLRDARDPRATEPLVRFFHSASEPRLRRLAAEALQAVAGPARIEEELKNLETLTEALRAVSPPAAPQ